VIGVGVKQSTSDLLVANCDEFIFYDDLVREQRRAAAKRDERKAQPQQGRRPSDGDNRKREEMEARKLQALEMVVETYDALVSERGDTGKIWASLLKDTLKRRRPDFSESYYGFRTFGNLLEEAQTRGLFEFGRDEKSGTYVFRGANAQADLQPVETAVEQPQAAAEPAVLETGDELAAETQGEQPTEVPASAREPRRRGGRGRKGREAQAPAPASEDAAMATWPAPTPDLAETPEPVVAAEEPAPPAESVEPAEPAEPAEEAPAAPKERRRATRTPRKPAARKGEAAAAEAATAAAAEPVAQEASPAPDAQPAEAPADADAAAAEGEGAKAARKKSARPSHKAPSRKPATRAPRRPAKAKTTPENS
jgi:hypothetical protein